MRILPVALLFAACSSPEPKQDEPSAPQPVAAAAMPTPTPAAPATPPPQGANEPLMPLAHKVLAAGRAMAPLRDAMHRTGASVNERIVSGRKCTEQMTTWRAEVEKIRDTPVDDHGSADFRAKLVFMQLFDCVSCWTGADAACDKVAAALK